MKYTEFLQLAEILEFQGTTISQEFKLNEAPDDTTSLNPGQKSEPDKTEKSVKSEETDSAKKDAGELKTEKGNIFTRWGLMKKKLNAQATKVQAGVLEKIIKKYLPTVLQGERAVAQQIINTKKTGENTDEEILQLVNKNLAAAKDKRQKQLSIIDEATMQYIKNAQDMMNKKIDSSKMNDKNKLNMKNYWILLLTQVKMNAYAKMTTLISEDVKKVFGEDVESLKIYQALENDLKTLQAKQAETKKIVDEQAAKIKELEKQLQTQTAEPKKLEVGKKYKYTTKNDQPAVIVVKEVLSPGVYQVAYVKDGKETSTIFSVKKTNINRVGEEVEAQVQTQPAAQPA